MTADLAAIFINRENGARCRVMAVDAGYAYLVIESGERSSRYSMPIAEYDGYPSIPVERHFTSLWRPATAEDLMGAEAPAAFRPPKPPTEPGETVEIIERVSIGGEMDGAPLP